MKSVFWIIPNRLAGRCGPGHEPWSLPELRAAGFDAILNLSEFAPAPSEFATAQLDLAWIPLPNTCPSDDNTERTCLRILPSAHAFLRAHLEADRSVLVHCALGRDRTGLLLAYHLAFSSGLASDLAIAAVRRACPKAITAPGWEAMAERVITTLLAAEDRVAGRSLP